MSYTVLARRYRSRDFDELVGQGVISDTLQRAVEQDRVAHAYLFCGTRGVGKTSLARILARALNAVDGLEDRDSVADAIMRGEDLDVIEIDGASNRGVEQARELISAAGLSPARCPYRIYIIDEVHMLTSEAFNTLLKTMEEPPGHVKFLLCTTEPHKVPATIRSRCQRFDFRPITRADIAAHLQHIIETEGVEAEAGVLDRVAAMGRGSMRDALGVLERLMASGDASITVEHVERTLGLPPADLVLALVDAVLDGDADASLRCADTLLGQGIALDQVIESLIEAWRGLMLQCACGPDTDLLDWPRSQRDAMAERSGRATADVFAHGVAVFEAVARQTAMAASARALFDAALVRLALGAALEDDGRPTREAPAVAARAKPVKKKVSPVAEPTVVQPEPVVDERAHSTETVSGGASAVECWRRVVEAMDGRGLQAAAQLLEAVSLSDGVLQVRAAGGTSGVLEARLDAMRQTVRSVLGEGVTLQVEAMAAEPRKSSSEAADGDPAVRMISEVFDAQVVDIRPMKE